MDFQSIARFGERRVMVTDYDETEVSVDSKVLDEDTGEVIAQSGGGGGSSDFSTAEVTFKFTFDEVAESLQAASLFTFAMPSIQNNTMYGSLAETNVAIAAGSTSKSFTYTTVLYKNSLTVSLLTFSLKNAEIAGDLTTSGDVVVSDANCVISGDCELTFPITLGGSN